MLRAGMARPPQPGLSSRASFPSACWTSGAGHAAKNSRAVLGAFLMRRLSLELVPVSPWARALDQHHRLRRDALATADEAEAFGSLGLYAHRVGLDPEIRGEVGTHRGDVGRHPGRLGDDGRIDVYYPVAVAGQQRRHLAQQSPAVDALVTRIAVGEMRTDIAQRRGAEQRVAQRMDQHVGVGVPGQSLVVRDLDAADDQLSSGYQRVRIKSLPDPHRSPPGLALLDAF